MSGLIVMLAGCSGSGEQAEDGTYTIAVIPKGTTHEFWKSVHAGAIKASRELGNVEILWQGPLKEDDREEQLQIVQNMIAGGVDALVLAPLDDRSLLRPVEEAKAQGIPTIVVDSDLQGDAHACFIATNNYKGGQLAGERVASLLDGKGKLIVIRYLEGSASTTNREEGFLSVIREKYPDIQILSDNQYSGTTTESAYRTAETLLNRFPDADAFFSPNESSTFGSLRALQERGLAGKMIFVGFDSSEKLIEGLRNGEIMGLMLQNPFQMGYQGLKTAVAYLNGETIPDVIDTGAVLATPDNIDDPDITALLSPDLAEYLD